MEVIPRRWSRIAEDGDLGEIVLYRDLAIRIPDSTSREVYPSREAHESRNSLWMRTDLASPLLLEKERPRRPFWGRKQGLGGLTRPLVVGSADSPGDAHRRQEKRRSALG